MKGQKKLILIYLSLAIMLFVSVKADKEPSEEESNEEEEENESWIDTGCVHDKPALCPSGICMASYDDCEIVSGCTSFANPLMCPTGRCVNNFEDCIEKNYECVVAGHKRCADGHCRVDCSGIQTNGCQMDNPYYCPTGRCVNYEIQCTDFRCSTFDEPYMCDDLTCKKSRLSCPANQTGILISREATEKTIHANDNIKNMLTVPFESEKTNLALKFYYTGANLFYSKFTAAFSKYKEELIEEYNALIKFDPIPNSYYEKSKISYDRINLEMELLTSNIFAKEFQDLIASEFIRSAVFKISIENYEYNHLFFSTYPTIQIKYTKLNPSIGSKKAGKKEEEEESSDLDNDYDINDASQIYCLGLYDTKQEKWFCVSRRPVTYSDFLIEYRVPMAGIYAILYYPAVTDEDSGPCGFVCKHKKVILSIILLIIPATILIFLYVKRKVQYMYAKTKKNFMALTVNDDDPFYNDKTSGFNKNFEPTNLLDEDNYEIKGDTYTFINPLLFGSDQNDTEKPETELENRKVKLKFKNSQVLNEKLLLLRKLSALNSEIADLKNDIARLRKLQGINVIYEAKENTM